MIDYPFHKLSYSISGASDATDYSRSYLYECIKSKRLKAYKRGGRTFVLHDELMKLVEDDARQVVV